MKALILMNNFHTLWRLTHQCNIPREIDSPGVSYPGEIDPPVYFTPGDWLARGIIPGGDWLARVYHTLGDWLVGLSYPREIHSPGYHTHGRLKNLNKTGECCTKIENILTHWSVEQWTGRWKSYEKNGRSKISLDCTYKKTTQKNTLMNIFVSE